MNRIFSLSILSTLLFATLSLQAITVLPIAFDRAALTIPVPDTTELLNEDAFFDSDPAYPYRFSILTTVNATPDNSGTRTFLPDGSSIWHLPISTSGAHGLSLTFSRFTLSQGDTLTLVNAAGALVGLWTEANNADSICQLPVSVGSQALLSLKQSPTSSANINLRSVGYNYRDFRRVPNRYNKASDNCSLHTASADANEIAPEKQGTCLIIYNDGSKGYACTAQLINNTDNADIPYILTAAHCVSSQALASTVVTYWNDEAPFGVSSIMGSTEHWISNSTFTAYNQPTDCSLLELSSFPTKVMRPYAYGWNRSSSDSPSAPFYCVHHPNSTPKRVAISDMSVTPNSEQINYDDGNGGTLSYDVGVAWHVSQWTTGTTEAGSSGSALLDENHRVIGTLLGGSSECSDPTDDFFCRFSKQWDAASLSSYLDNASTGATTLDGRDPYASNPATRVSPITSIAASSATQMGLVASATRYAQKITLDHPSTLLGLYLTCYTAPLPTSLTIASCLSSSDSIQTIDIPTVNIPQWNASTTEFYYNSQKNLSLIAKADHFIPMPSNGIEVGTSFYVIFDVSSGFQPYATTASSSSAFVEVNEEWKSLSTYGSQNALWIDAVVADGWTGSARLAQAPCSDVSSITTTSSKPFNVFPTRIRPGETLTIQTPDLLPFSISLFDEHGVQVFSRSFPQGASSHELPIPSNSKPGLYILRFEGSQSHNTKLIIAH